MLAATRLLDSSAVSRVCNSPLTLDSRRYIQLFACLAALITCSTSLSSASQTQVSKVWVADRGDGTYRNPILHADYSDPDVVRVGEDFYMTASSFNSAPGLPILHSRDLVNWSLIGHALERQTPIEIYNKP